MRYKKIQLVAFLLNGILSLPIYAQVIIKDTVVISPFQSTKRGIDLSSFGSDSILIAPRSGIVGISPREATKLSAPLPADAHVLIALPETTIALPVLPFLPCSTTYLTTSTFDSCGIQRNYTYYRRRLCDGPVDTFYTSVEEGDTIRFAFQGEFYNPTEYILPFTPTLWEVIMGEQGCADDWIESCYLYFFYADTLVKFITPDTSVYPTYPNRNDSLAKKNWMDIELRVEYADSGIPNFWVRVDTSVVVDSGGHSHSHTLPRRPVGRYIHPINSTDTTDTLLARTDSTGKLRFRYVASQVGGRERITARLVSDTTKFDTLSVTMRVPGLITFPAGGNYQLTGSLPWHPNNHYFASQTAIDSLIFAANEFAREKWNTTGVMRLNDMSLRLGGIFDVDTNWTTPHSAHRIGKSVDIENIDWERVDTVNSAGDTVHFSIPKVKWIRDFARFMEVKMRRWHFEDEGQTRPNVFRRTRKFPHFEWMGN